MTGCTPIPNISMNLLKQNVKTVDEFVKELNKSK